MSCDTSYCTSLQLSRHWSSVSVCKNNMQKNNMIHRNIKRTINTEKEKGAGSRALERKRQNCRWVSSVFMKRRITARLKVNHAWERCDGEIMEKKESNTERQRSYRDMGVWVGGFFLDKEHLCPWWCLVSLVQWFTVCVSECVCDYGLAYYSETAQGKERLKKLH